MDLGFETVHRMQGDDGRWYLVQRANVTRNGRFWMQWKSGGRAQIERLFAMRREIANGRSCWFAYWTVPEEGGLPIPMFDVSYQLRSDAGLLPYQPVAVQHICNSVLKNGSALDGSDTGLGKTYVALAAARDLGLIPHVLCRKGGIPGWKEASEMMKVKCEFIVNWEMAKSKSFPYADTTTRKYSTRPQVNWRLHRRAILIFDEAHMANNPGTQNNALYRFSKGIPSIALSATFADKPVKMMPFLDHLGIISSEDFLKWLKSRGHMPGKYEALEGFSDLEDMKAINRAIYPSCGYRLRYDDPKVKDFFPDAIYQVEKIGLSKKNTKLHNEAHRLMLERLAELEHKAKEAREKVGHMAKAVLELRYRQAAELLKADALYDYARNLLEQGRSVCIFVNYRETLGYLAGRFKTRSLIYGGQESDRISRSQVIEDFQNNRSRLLIAMLQAGGVSINLHDLDGRFPRVSLICPTYNATDLQQVFGRTHRAKAKSTPVIKLVYSAGTVEEKVAERVRAKLMNIKMLNDGDLVDEQTENARYGSFHTAQEVG